MCSKSPQTSEVALRGLGKTLSESVLDGGYGAYEVSGDNDCDYYLVRWVGTPWKVEEDGEIMEGENAVRVSKGEMSCKAEWFYKVPGTRLWFTPSTERCIVRMQQVLAADLDLAPIGNGNKLPTHLPRQTVADAKSLGAMKVKEEDHDAMMDESERRDGVDFEEIEEDEETGDDGDGEYYSGDAGGEHDDVGSDQEEQ